MTKIVIPNTGAGFINPNEDLVGFQTTQGGGLTNTNFVWNYGAVEKIDKDYQSGVFSNPITLSDLNVDAEEAKKALSVDLKVFPSYDLTEVTNFTLYGSLTKRFSASITQIINFFPAACAVTVNFLSEEVAGPWFTAPVFVKPEPWPPRCGSQ